MALDFPLGRAVDAAGGALFMLLGAWVLAQRPRRRANTLLATFLLLFGAYFVVDNVALGLERRRDLRLVLGLLGAAAGVAMLAVAALVPRPLAPGERWRLVVPAVLVTAPMILRDLAVVDRFRDVRGGLDEYVDAAGWALLVGSLFAAGISWGLRHRLATTRAERLQYALLAAAAMLYAAFRQADDVVFVARSVEMFPAAEGLLGFLRFAAYEVVVLAVVLGLWIANAASRPDPALARNVVLAVVAAGLAGLANDLAIVHAGVDVGGYGLVRGVAVVLLTVAILRGQILDVDLKLRWGISRGTVAAAFLVAFFVVSEAAQAFFAGQAGSEYLGILAAGALVFALAPLQRAAERVADAAVPARPAATGGPLDAYRAALRLALADGAVSRDEERELARLQADLGIGPVEALEAREEAEAARLRSRESH